MLLKLICATLATAEGLKRFNEFVELPDHTVKDDFSDPLPHQYGDFMNNLPDDWFWGNINGTNYLTRNLNQHIPQYCGSCWAHGAMSALGDRIKIQRMRSGLSGPDINLSIQWILNCGGDIG